jgi:hypothetical protein
MAGAILIGLGCLGLALCYKPFRFRFELLLAWILAPRPVWFGILSATVLTFLFRYALADHERAFQYAGLTLQLLGISAVARGISQKLSTFGKTGLRAWFMNWGRQFLGIFARSQSHHLEATLGSLSVVGFAPTIVQTRTKPSDLRERVEQLETEVLRLDGELKSTKEALAKERHERIEADDREHSSLVAQIAKIREVIERATVGSFRDEIVGVLWLAYGTVCATIPKQIAALW